MASILIDLPKIFSAKETLFFLNRSSRECLFTIEGQKINRLARLRGKLFLLEVHFRADTIIEVVVLNETASKTEIDLIRAYIRLWLGLDDDLEPFYQMAASDTILHDLTNRYRGLRLIGIPDLFEAISWAIIGQQINLSFAYTIKSRFVLEYGDQFMYDGKTYYHFPTPARVAKIPREALLNLKFSRQKADYIRGIAQSFKEEKLMESELKKMNYQEAKTKLTSFKGIGNWSADYVLMKTFKHPQAFPVQDAGLLNALKIQLGLSAKPSIEKINEISKPWSGYKALATFYLWRSLMD